MKSLVIFDSNYGNTKIIAETIAQTLGGSAIHVADFTLENLAAIELLVVGSPINGWRPTETMGVFLQSLPGGSLEGMAAATFDTRINVFYHGDAAKKIAAALKRAGASIAGIPGTFFVKGTEGPLIDGEVERAQEWARSLVK